MWASQHLRKIFRWQSAKLKIDQVLLRKLKSIKRVLCKNFGLKNIQVAQRNFSILI